MKTDARSRPCRRRARLPDLAVLLMAPLLAGCGIDSGWQQQWRITSIARLTSSGDRPTVISDPESIARVARFLKKRRTGWKRLVDEPPASDARITFYDKEQIVYLVDLYIDDRVLVAGPVYGDLRIKRISLDDMVNLLGLVKMGRKGP
jgi:hypothetical protein